MKTLNIHSLLILIIISLNSCNELGNQKNPLYGKIFREHKEIPSLRKHNDLGGAIIVIDSPSVNMQYGISHYLKGNDHIMIFNEFIEQKNSNKVKYKILDTINIDNVKNNQYVSYCDCLLNSNGDNEIIAVVLAEDNKEYFDKVYKAWRADTETGKIEPINNVAGIKCINEGYGLDECSEE